VGPDYENERCGVWYECVTTSGMGTGWWLNEHDCELPRTIRETKNYTKQFGHLHCELHCISHLPLLSGLLHVYSHVCIVKAGTKVTLHKCCWNFSVFGSTQCCQTFWKNCHTLST
jgi:hypothetical protein